MTIRRGHRRVAAASAAIICTAAATCAPLLVGRASATAPSAHPQEFAPGDRSFFAEPEPIPAGNHGDLIRFQVVESGDDVTYRIMYLSASVSGAPTVVTGLVSADVAAPPVDGYRLLLHGHGTTGIADHCAPSRSIDAANDFYAKDFNEVESATSQGFVVVSTDYEGLGGPGRHPYLVGVSEGRSMLDAGIAARQLPDLNIGTATAVVGFSQGGHAALWAAQLATDWTPSYPISGVVLGAPASEVGTLANMGAGRPELGALTVSIVAGLAAAYPEAEAALPEVLTPAGMEVMALMDEHCFAESVPVPPGPYVAADPNTVEPFASLLAANTPGMTPTAAPILVFHGDADPAVPVTHSETLSRRLCDGGHTIERRVLPGQAHVASADRAYADGVAWLEGLADGTAQAATTCPG